MKQTKRSHYKMALLALASAAMLTPAVRGATISPNMGDVILGFRANANPGQTVNLEVDLGPVSQFYGLTAGQVINFPGLSIADLSATYDQSGTNWMHRTDVFWGAVATAGRASGFSNNVVNVPVGTLWATVPNCGTAFNKGSSFAQKNASATIEAAFVAGSPLNGATSTANSSSAALITATLAGSWSAQDLKTGGTSFGYFNPTIDNFEGTNIVASQFYELQPGSGPGTYLGDFYIDGTGLHFRAAQATAAVCKSGVVLLTGTNCTATATESDIDNGSTGFCLSESIDATGPLAIGTTNITLTVIDGFGTTNSCTTLVTVQGAAPSLTATAPISQCNPVVTYVTPTASGCNTPIGAVSCSPASGSTFHVGTTNVICTATDAFGKIGTNSFAVTIADAGPSVSCPGNITTNVIGNGTSMVLNYTTPSGTGCATPINVVCVPASGATFSIGTTNVHCTATDANNLTGTCSFSVTVGGAGIAGIEGQVSALTDPKLNSARITGLLKNLQLAATDLAKTNVHQQASKTIQACAQLKGFLVKVSVYGKLGILASNEVASLTAAVHAEQATIGCK